MNLLLALNATQNPASSALISPGLQTTLVGVLLIVVALLVLWRFRQVIVNSVLGIIALFLLQVIGILIPINLVTIIISAALGLIGVGLMVLLYVLGFSF